MDRPGGVQVSRRKQCPCGKARKLPGLDECRTCRVKDMYKAARECFRLARCGIVNPAEAIDNARVVREEVRSLRGAA